jgi:hypothetical protein
MQETTMHGMIEGQKSTFSAESVTNRLVTDAKRDIGVGADERFLEYCAREAVREVWHDSVKVTTFVPVLAMRRMREMVSSRDDVDAGGRDEV